MGKSAKFYKKPSLKEKQSGAGKSRSSASTPAAAVVKTKDAAKRAVTGEALQKRQQLEEKARRKEEATRAPKSVFRPQAANGRDASAEPIDNEHRTADSDEEMDQGDTIKRRPRTKQRKDWGPMPKDVGVDYLRQWDSRHS